MCIRDSLYTEVGRHGSAGIRSRQPFAVTGNSGTAHIDYGWLERQGARRLFDTVDALAIHPYTNNSTCTEAASPEAFRLDEQFRRLYDLVFRYGGMKELWNTEFGWPNGAAEHERHRTNLYIRMLIFGDAAGMRMQTVYNLSLIHISPAPARTSFRSHPAGRIRAAPPPRGGKALCTP